MSGKKRRKKFSVKYVPNHIVEKCHALGSLHARQLDNGDYELYDGKTGKVIQTISKSDIDEAALRLGLPNSPPER